MSGLEIIITKIENVNIVSVSWLGGGRREGVFSRIQLVGTLP